MMNRWQRYGLLGAMAALLIANSYSAATAQPAPLMNLRPHSADTAFLSVSAYLKKAAEELAPGGTLRVAINLGNPVLATKDPSTGEPRGVAVTLGAELASLLKVRFAPITYSGVGGIVDAARAGAWDVAFLAIDPARAADMDFTPPYMLVDNTLLVPPGSSVRSMSDADRSGLRIAVQNRTAPDLFLSETLQRAQLVRAASLDAAVALIRAGQADVLAANRQALTALAEHLPGFMILPDGFLEVRHAIAVPKGHRFGLSFARQFVEFAKASGMVQRALEQAGVRGVKIAPQERGAGK